MSKIVDLYNRLGLLRVKIPRLIDAHKELKMKKDNFPFKQPTKEQYEAIKSFWRGIKPNIKYLSLYNYDNEVFDPRYIPDDIYYTKVDMYFNNGIECFSLDDKNLYDLYFPDVKQPKTIARKNNGLFTNEKYEIISLQSVVERCRAQGEVIIKKSTLSNGGKNITFWRVTDGDDILITLLAEPHNYIIQEVVSQHSSIGKIHPSSLNSIRVLSLTYENQVHILSTIVRMGVNGNNVDNGHSGGIFCGVNNDGQFKDMAYSYMTGERFYDIHPSSNVKFSDCHIPNFTVCKETIKRLAPRLSRFSRLTSWDFTIDTDGNPVLIEVNLAYGGLFFHQIANGPVFGELTERVLNEIFNRKS